MEKKRVTTEEFIILLHSNDYITREEGVYLLKNIEIAKYSLNFTLNRTISNVFNELFNLHDAQKISGLKKDYLSKIYYSLPQNIEIKDLLEESKVKYVNKISFEY